MLAPSPCCQIPVYRRPGSYQAYRISPNDRHRIAIVVDPAVASASLTVCVEIFEPGSKTPFHDHHRAVEMFFILKGRGQASCDGKIMELQAGDTILVPPTSIHEIRNTGPGRLYALCIMVPNEDFAELIRRGIPVELDDEDLQVLTRQDARWTAA